MRLKVIENTSEHASKGGDPVCCLCWTSNGELLSIGDDQKALRWTRDGKCLGESTLPIFGDDVTRVDSAQSEHRNVYFTAANSHVSANAKTDLLALGCADGRLVILTSRLTRPEKIVEAHRGAVLAIEWSSDASTLLTGGEEGIVKIWSKSGMLRSQFLSQGAPIYAACWSPDSNQILVTTGNNITIKSLQPGARAVSWKAHDGSVSCVSWSKANSLILSGGEDKRYKIWDNFGRLIYASTAIENVVTVASWSFLGSSFVIGSYNSLRICDKMGWTRTMADLEGGSLYAASWAFDGTTLACSTSQGRVLMVHSLGRRIDWRNLEVTIVDERQIQVLDIQSGSDDKYELRDVIVKVEVGHYAIVILSVGQVHVLHRSKSLHTFDLPVGHGRIASVCLSSNHFTLVDRAAGIHVYTYSAAKPAMTIKLQGAEHLTDAHVAISDDSVVVRDPVSENKIVAYDLQSGEIASTLSFAHPIRGVSVDQVGRVRHVAAVDRNGDMWLAQVGHGEARKIGTMVESARFAEDSGLLCAVADGRVMFWYCPVAVFADKELLSHTRVARQATKCVGIEWFAGMQCAVRTGDGARQIVGVGDPWVGVLHEHAGRKKWDVCLRICRSARSTALWATLAGLAVQGNELNTAEVAYASLGEVHKVQAICAIRELCSSELRLGETLVFRGMLREAEAQLLAAGHVYSAIRMWLDAFGWDRALDLGLKHRAYLGLVLAARRDYVRRMEMAEVSKRYLALQSDTDALDMPAIRALAITEERKRVQMRP